MKYNERGLQIPHYLEFMFFVLLIKLISGHFFTLKMAERGNDHFKSVSLIKNINVRILPFLM